MHISRLAIMIDRLRSEMVSQPSYMIGFWPMAGCYLHLCDIGLSLQILEAVIMHHCSIHVLNNNKLSTSSILSFVSTKLPFKQANCKALIALLISPAELSARLSMTSLGGMWNFTLLWFLRDFFEVPVFWHSENAIFWSVFTMLVWAIGLKLHERTEKNRET